MRPPPLPTSPFTSLNQFSPRPSLWVAIPAGFGLTLLMGLVDYWFASRHLYLPIYYWIPIFGLAWFSGWRLSLLATLLAALINFAIDLVFSAGFAYPLLIYLGSAAVFLIAGWVARALSTWRLMHDYYRQRGEVWKAITPPFRVGQRFMIIPASKNSSRLAAEVSPSDLPLILEPGLAFGPGPHFTTEICLALLERYLKPGDRVFDLGCGSGILAIAAAKLGASAVLAVDNDPEAEQVTQKNIQLNGVVDRVEFRLGSLAVAFAPQPPPSNPPPYQITVANLLTTIIIQVLNEGLARTLAPDGVLILSGIRAEQADPVGAALTAAGLTIIEQQQTKDWLALVTKRG